MTNRMKREVVRLWLHEGLSVRQVVDTLNRDPAPEEPVTVEDVEEVIGERILRNARHNPKVCGTR